MPMLHVILERGFSGLEACVELEGRELLRSDALPPDMMKGFSAQVDTPRPPSSPADPPPLLVVTVPEYTLRLEIPLPSGEEEIWVVVRRTPTGLVSEIGTEPRGYM